MRIKALTLRILIQISHDKRTLALILLAPLLLLSLVYFILTSPNTSFNIGIISAPDAYVEELSNTEDFNINLTYLKEDDVHTALKEKQIIAAITIDQALTQATIYLDGTNSVDATQVVALLKRTALTVLQSSREQDALALKEVFDASLAQLNNLSDKLPNMQLDTPEVDLSVLDFTEPTFTTNYIYGLEDSSMFDNFGAGLVGIIVFFFVFLIAGINFLTERTSGTLEKLLSTPIKRSEIIIGYVLGFSLLALFQTLLITLFVVYVLNLTVLGSIWYVFLINLLTAITALTLGILLSTLANNEFQMVQFIPIVIIPQIFLCGLFTLSDNWQLLGYLTPLHYTTNALTEVMLRGNGFSTIASDCLILLCYSLVFIFLNIQLLKRHRTL